jgi:hypothetical protein
MSAPVCRSCGKPLRKYVESLNFGGRLGNNRGRPYCSSREEAQRYVNGQIISVKWGLRPIHNEAGVIVGQGTDRVIYHAGVWDGESYGVHGEGFFCSQSCGYQLGRAAARQGMQLRRREPADAEP